jgi:hypothetical protein
VHSIQARNRHNSPQSHDVSSVIQVGEHPAHHQKGANPWHLHRNSDVKSVDLLPLTRLAGSWFDVEILNLPCTDGTPKPPKRRELDTTAGKRTPKCT